MAGHFAESILSKCGHGEWVAYSIDEYVSIATRLASNPDLMTRLRTDLRSDLAASGLCNSRLCASELEDSFIQMINQAISNQEQVA